MRKFKTTILICWLTLIAITTLAQSGQLTGNVTDSIGKSIAAATIVIPELNLSVETDRNGFYQLTDIPFGNWVLEVSFIGFESFKATITIHNEVVKKDVTLNQTDLSLNAVVISGTMKEVSKLESSVPIEVYTAKFFKANPTPSLFEALQNINGVHPQVNCSVCNTGDIHINGLEGPYTMILIDGMPIVSGLSTVYGLSGIPQSLIERVEIVKGPASTLYGSEAVGGLINVITKNPSHVPLLSADVFGTDWKEINADVAAKFNVGKKVQSLLGITYFNYQNPIDNNNDDFTDLTLQNRISVFNKWNFVRKDSRVFSMAGRYVYEDRWGGEMDWTKKNRGGDEVYAESIFTKRWELFGIYQLPVKEPILFQFSTNGHSHNSYYGDVPYMADQNITFGQLTWNKQINNHDFLTGLSYRYTYYDDNTPATASFENLDKNKPSHAYLPGIFVQDEISLNDNNKLLLGMRYDYNSIHGSILTPRINYKWNSKNKHNILRISLGNGYRVANVFTEDHAALTGAREVVFLNELKPETSWNGNFNFVKNIFAANSTFIGLDASAFYTHFNNKIIADHETDVNKIIYDNLDGYAVSKGISINMDIAFNNGLKLLLGATAMDVYSKEDEEKTRQLFTEKFTGVWNIGYTLRKFGLTLDYTGNLYGSMRLPLISEADPRKEYSPWWSIQNIQITKSINSNFEIYGGVKNLLNWTPNRGNPFIIARTNDPFDNEVLFNGNGQALVTPNNPHGLTFDPDYIYASNQGIRGFFGMRYTLF